MPETDDIRAVVLQWIKKAENDLKNAVHTLKLGEDCPTDTVGFHAQQCVEKYLKGLLCFRRIDFPKTHNITELVALLPASTPVDLTPNPHYARATCCDRGYGRPSGRPRVSNLAAYRTSTPQVRVPVVAQWHGHLHDLVTPSRA